MSNPASRPQQVVFGQKIPAALVTPVALSATPLLVTNVIITAIRGRTPNSGIVYLGSSSTDDTQLFPLAIGQSIQLFADETGLIDLSQIFIDAVTLGDGVQFLAVVCPNQ